MKIQTSLTAFVFLLSHTIIIHSQAPDYPLPHPKGYVCYKTSTNINIDGALTEPIWELTEWTDTFTDISGSSYKTPRLSTKVKMLWDHNNLYIAAELEEPHLWGTITERDNVIFKDNDFEVFIDPDGDNHHYYELEINVLNTIWDLLLTKPYRDGGAAIDNFDFKDLMTAVATYGTVDNPDDNDEKWTIEIAIPWHNFEVWNPKRRTKNPEDGEQWRINFSRVQWELDPTQYSYTKKLDFRRNPLAENNWAWSPQGVIQMHQPETWGYVQFSKEYVGTTKAEFKKDLDFNLKMALMDIYFQQRRYYQKNHSYTKNINELQISEYNLVRFSKKIKIESIQNRFIAYAEGYKGIWQINEQGQITSSPIKLETSF